MTGEYIPPTPRKAMTPKRRAEVLLKCMGKCARCGARIVNGQFEADHEISLYSGGKDELSNLVALCPPCHRGEKTPADAAKHAKIDRLIIRRAGIKKRSRLSHPTLRKKLSGEVVPR